MMIVITWTAILVVVVVGQPMPVWTDNCLNANTPQGTCVECVQGFYLQYFLCLPCAPLCICSSQYNYCESCMILSYKTTNYSRLAIPQAATNSCVLCDTQIPSCLQCLNSSFCTLCYGGLYPTATPNGTLCSPDQCDNNCEVCHDDKTCQRCQEGYFLDQHGKCSKNQCQANCSVCASNSTCSTCLLGFHYDTKRGCIPCIDNCLVCSKLLECDLCAPGYYPTSFENLTVCADSGFSNCIDYYPAASGASACMVCEPGYFVLYGNCGQCVGCELCSLQFLCQTPCLPGATPFNYACLVPFIIAEPWLVAGVSLLVVLLTL